MPLSANDIALIAFAVASVGLVAVVGAEGARMTSRRYQLAWTDPGQLAAPPIFNPLLARTASFVGLVVMLLALALLAPISPLWKTGVGTSLLLFGEGILASAALFLHLRRAWSVPVATLGCALLTLAISSLLRCALGSSGLATSHLVVLMFGAIIAAALWWWLADVWDQQLDDSRAWTVAGRMIPLLRYFAAGNIVFAIITGLVAARAVSTWGIVGHVFLIVVSAACWRRFRGTESFFLFIVSVVGLFWYLILSVAR